MLHSDSSKDNTINKNKEIEIESLKKIIDKPTTTKDAFKKTIEKHGREKDRTWVRMILNNRRMSIIPISINILTLFYYLRNTF